LICCGLGGWIAVKVLDPFPTREFVDRTGPVAARYLDSWDFSVDPAKIRRVSRKSASTIDSYSRWSKYELAPSDAQTLASEFHQRMADIMDYLYRNRNCEQATRKITSIPIQSPSSKTLKWWMAPSRSGDATENMIFHKEGGAGTGQGCYTIYDPATETLWVYEFAAQTHQHWKRGERPAYVPADKGVESPK
jgi:hypothetical protein